MQPEESKLAKIRVKKLYESSDGSPVRVIKVDWKRNLAICRNYHSHRNQAFPLDEAAATFTPLLKVGEVAKMFGVKADTIRRYENLELLPKPRKISLNADGKITTRVYSPSDIEVLTEFFDRRRPVGRPGPANIPGINRNAIKVKIDASYLRGR